jgi:malate synthase
VHEHSKGTTLPIARAIVDRYVREPVKLPWFIDLLNLTLGTHDLDEALRRIDVLARMFREQGARLTTLLENHVERSAGAG